MTFEAIIEEAQHRRSEHPRVTQLPEPVSPMYRNQSEKWNTTTGANVSTMNRASTSLVRAVFASQRKEALSDDSERASDLVFRWWRG